MNDDKLLTASERALAALQLIDDLDEKDPRLEAAYHVLGEAMTDIYGPLDIDDRQRRHYDKKEL